MYNARRLDYMFDLAAANPFIELTNPTVAPPGQDD